MMKSLVLLPLFLLFHCGVICVNAQNVLIGFTLIQAPTKVFGPMPNVVNLVNVGSSLNMKADTSTTIALEKVMFWFDGKLVRTETVTPYSLGGDRNGKYNSFSSLTIEGNHNVTAEAFDLVGKSVGKRSIEFKVIKSNATAAVPSSNPASVPVVAPTKSPIVPVATPVVVNPPLSTPINSQFVQIKGELRKWHKVTLAFTGPFATETDTNINPFMDYRLNVVFTHIATGKQYNVPGYFAADGNAAETSASSGDQWYCHFAPDEIGVWTFITSFVGGSNVAVSTTTGVPTSFHGQTGSFSIQSSNKTGRDHRGKGQLQYVGQHHLQFAETGEWFLKAGVDRYD
jgi:Domain of unknown function (DUF5060)